MKKVAFLIPGFKETINRTGIKDIAMTLEKKGWKVEKVQPTWNYHVMSDYIKEFVDYYSGHHGDQNLVLGFSYGAVVAFATAQRLKPNFLFLCSLSSDFVEDKEQLYPWEERYLGKHRIADRKNLYFDRLTTDIPSTTAIFLGEIEAEKFPSMEIRARIASEVIPGSLIRIAKAKHNLGQPEYLAAVLKEIEKVV